MVIVVIPLLITQHGKGVFCNNIRKAGKRGTYTKRHAAAIDDVVQKIRNMIKMGIRPHKEK